MTRHWEGGRKQQQQQQQQQQRQRRRQQQQRQQWQRQRRRQQQQQQHQCLCVGRGGAVLRGGAARLTREQPHGAPPRGHRGPGVAPGLSEGRVASSHVTSRHVTYERAARRGAYRSSCSSEEEVTSTSSDQLTSGAGPASSSSSSSSWSLCGVVFSSESEEGAECRRRRGARVCTGTVGERGAAPPYCCSSSSGIMASPAPSLGHTAGMGRGAPSAPSLSESLEEEPPLREHWLSSESLAASEELVSARPAASRKRGGASPRGAHSYSSSCGSCNSWRGAARGGAGGAAQGPRTGTVQARPVGDTRDTSPPPPFSLLSEVDRRPFTCGVVPPLPFTSAGARPSVAARARAARRTCARAGVRGRSAADSEAVRCGRRRGDSCASGLASCRPSVRSRMKDTELLFSTTAFTHGDGGGDSGAPTVTSMPPPPPPPPR
ncbi:hypothetical protein E2C01_053213 [Portunus trituberculatus]|uniref:Uncharacterized protein n=1 Tax=Portunus trituberculatus TaxID=210409 RepID=A0A5B7GPQ5_PORTR|nr:hypothetical protein [Portunus trituberculatus]